MSFGRLIPLSQSYVPSERGFTTLFLPFPGVCDRSIGCAEKEQILLSEEVSESALHESTFGIQSGRSADQGTLAKCSGDSKNGGPGLAANPGRGLVGLVPESGR